VTFAPFSDPGTGTDAGTLTSVRAHLLSSFNLADFVVSVPSTIFTRFLQSESNTWILAAPRLRAAEGKKTSLKIGTEVPVPVTTFQATQTGGTTFSPATSFQYRNVGVNLDVTPKVNPAGDITLELTAEFSLLGAAASFSEDGPSLPTFLTRNVTGVLRLRDGETSLIGGLLQREENESFQGIIGLQSIPVLNKIFTSVSKTPQDTEILISITPHILRAPKVIDEDLAGLVVGTEEIPRVEGARPPLFGPLIEGPPPGGAAGRGAATASPSVPPRAATSVPPPAPSPVPATPPANVPSAAPSAPLSRAEDAAAVPGVSGATSSPDAVRLTGQLLPSEALVKVGDAVTVSLVVVGFKDVTSLDAVLTFDSSIEVVEATAGSLLTLDGTAVGAERAFEPGRARVKLTKATPTSGSGAVLSLRLRGVAPGTTALAVESLSVSAAGVEKPVSVSTSRVVVNP
jgi:general secretion pathway protein D